MIQHIPGDVLIKSVSIFVNAGPVNITELVRGISIYESILTPGVVAQFSVEDTRNLLSALPVLGGERLVLEFTAIGRKERKLELVVANVSDSNPSTNLRSKTFILEAVTPEVFRDKTVQVCKSYNTNISSIVEDVTKSYLKTNKKVNVQSTRGVQKIIIPSKTPFEAIKMLRQRAVSVEDKSSLYVYFENIDGIHFRTIENLMSNGSVGDRVFSNDETIRTDVSAASFRNILSYSQPDQFDIVDRMRTGATSYEVNKFDLKTLSYNTTVSKFNEANFKSADGQLKNPYNANALARFGNPGSSNWVTHDSGNPDTFISEGLGGRANMASIMGQGYLHLHVFGDSELSAGQLIDCNILDNVSGSMSPTLHPQLSGKYMIAFIRHIIGTEGSSPRYTCSIEAIKGGYKRDVQ